MQPRVLHDTNAIAPANILTLRGSTVDLERGDLLSYESSVAVLMDTVTEDSTFCGVALTQYSDNYRAPQQVVAALVCMVEIDATSATYDVFDGLKLASSNTLVADGSANTIAWCAEIETSAASRIKAYINVPALGKLFAVSA